METKFEFVCDFTTFLQAYYGTESVDEQIENAVNDFFNQSSDENLPEDLLRSFYGKSVKIHDVLQDPNGMYELNLQVDNYQFMCISFEFSELFSDLIKLINKQIDSESEPIIREFVAAHK